MQFWLRAVTPSRAWVVWVAPDIEFKFNSPLALRAPKRYYLTMTDKQAVIDALQRLPEDVSIEEITEELRIMAAIRRGRDDIAAGRTKTQEEAER